MERILIAYATKTGTAADVALQLAHRPKLPPVDLFDCRAHTLTPLGEAPRALPAARLSLAPYRAVALGTGMYMGKPLRALSDFCAGREAELAALRPVLYTCGIGTEEEDRRYLTRALPAGLMESATLYRHAGGELRLARMGALSRLAMRGYAREHAAALGLNPEAIRALGDALAHTARGEAMADA